MDALGTFAAAAAALGQELTLLSVEELAAVLSDIARLTGVGAPFSEYARLSGAHRYNYPAR